MLSELSNKIKILAGTSPSPDPGGNGFEYDGFKNWKNKNITEKYLNIFSKHILTAPSLAIFDFLQNLNTDGKSYQFLTAFCLENTSDLELCLAVG